MAPRSAGYILLSEDSQLLYFLTEDPDLKWESIPFSTGTIILSEGAYVTTWDADSKLNTTGGTITGTLRINQSLSVPTVSNDTYNQLSLPSSSSPGFQLYAANGTFNIYLSTVAGLDNILTVSPDELTYKGYDIITAENIGFQSVSNATNAEYANKDSEGNIIKDTYLAKTTTKEVNETLSTYFFSPQSNADSLTLKRIVGLTLKDIDGNLQSYPNTGIRLVGRNRANQELLLSATGIQKNAQTGYYYGSAYNFSRALPQIFTYNTYKPNTAYTFGFTCYGSSSASGVVFRFDYTDGTSSTYTGIGGTTPKSVSVVSNPQKSIKNYGISFIYANEATVYIKDIYCYEGSYPDFSYVPYTETYINYPTTITSLPDYGISAAGYANYIDFTKPIPEYNRLIQSKVFSSNDSWTVVISESNPSVTVAYTDVSVIPDHTVNLLGTGIASHFEFNSSGVDTPYQWRFQSSANSTRVYFYIPTSVVSDLPSWHQYLAILENTKSPLIIHYLIQNKTSTPLSYLTPYKTLVTQPGGSITFLTPSYQSIPVLFTYYEDSTSTLSIDTLIANSIIGTASAAIAD